MQRSSDKIQQRTGPAEHMGLVGIRPNHLSAAKGQLISKGLFGILNSSKNEKIWLNYYDTLGRLVFVRFLEEFEDNKTTFRNYLTFSDLKNFANSIKFFSHDPSASTKGQLISKGLFGVFNFFQKKKNENKSTWGIIVVRSNSFVRFLEEFTAWQFAFELNWPLAQEKSPFSFLAHSISATLDY